MRICERGVLRGREQGYDVVVLDTGGRLHIDDELMGELVAVMKRLSRAEVLLVADAMTGQDAVNMAAQFDQRVVGLTGVILTKVEGDARGGAVLSIRAVTQNRSSFSAWVKNSMPWNRSILTAWPADSGHGRCAVADRKGFRDVFAGGGPSRRKRS
ncbi:MAG: hypothetical protein U0361_20900 [Nitrospiraceae bacterium]